MTREEKKIERRAAKGLDIDLNKLRVNRVKTGDVVFVALCVLVIIVCVLPMINLLAKSLSGSDYLVKREVYLLPKGFNLGAYKSVRMDSIPHCGGNYSVTYNDYPLRLSSYIR